LGDSKVFSVRKLLAEFVYSLEPRWFATILNARNLIGGSGLVIRYVPDSKVWSLVFGAQSIYVHDKQRIPIYRQGIVRRVQFMETKYFLKEISFREGDVVVDCGANVGEVGVALQKRGVRYFGFEPDPLAASACRLNNPAGTVIESGLWKSDGTVNFYMQPGTADSSIIEPGEYEQQMTIKVTRLDSFCQKNEIERVKLLKVEAEGADIVLPVSSRPPKLL
jgi:FkbM family methyltransferase